MQIDQGALTQAAADYETAVRIEKERQAEWLEAKANHERLFAAYQEAGEAAEAAKVSMLGLFHPEWTK